MGLILNSISNSCQDSALSEAKSGQIAKNSSLTEIVNYIFENSKHFARWVCVDHPDLWASILPSSCSPVVPIPFKREKDLLASAEEQNKIAALFKGRTLLEFCEDESTQKQFQLSERGSYIFGEASLTGVLIKAYIPEKDWVLLTRDEIPFLTCFPKLTYNGKGSSCGRAIMADRMRSLIEKERWDKVYVPKKTICPISSKPGAECVILAEKLDLMTYKETKAYLKHLSKEESNEVFRQFFALLFQTGASDIYLMKEGNTALIKSGPHQGKLAIFDTEPIGIDEIHEGTFIEPDVEAPSSSDLYRNIFLIGGKRNFDLSIGRAFSKEFIESVRMADAELSKADRKFFSEFRSNFLKAWALRLLFPTTLVLSVAIPIFQQYLKDNRRVVN